MINENILNQIYSDCTLCPRNCHVNRYEQSGFCGAGVKPKLARAALHMWEEPCLGGGPDEITNERHGSGAVFFSNCTLQCIFCQNYDISIEGFGKEVSAQELSGIFLNLQNQGAANLDLVTPTHYLPSVIEALDIIKKNGELKVPVVYNCGGYEKAETIKLLEGYVDIYLPDMKYYSDEAASRYSNAPGYYSEAIKAVKEMIRQTGAPEFIESGSGDTPRLKKGVIIRHMVVPGLRNDSIELLKAIHDELEPDSYLISLMSQYTPFYKAITEPQYKSVNRRITSFEYDSVVKEALSLNMNGFMQEKSSAKEEYTPSFNLEGVL